VKLLLRLLYSSDAHPVFKLMYRIIFWFGRLLVLECNNNYILVFGGMAFFIPIFGIEKIPAVNK